MTLPIKLILSCLVIPAMASNIQTKPIQALESPQQLVKGINLLWGSGAESSQLPIIVYSTHLKTFHLRVYIIQSKKQCDEMIFASRNIKSIEIHTIKQFADDNKVLFIWSTLTDIDNIKRVTILDVDTCAFTMNMESDVSPADFRIVVIPFANSFDVISTGNFHVSYHTDGNLIGQPTFFPINSRDFSIDPVSPKSNTNGFFIADYMQAVLKLVQVDGRLKKLLLKPMPKAVFTNNEQSSYSVCWFDIHRVLVHCFQYDEAGNEKWRNQVTLGFGDGALNVKNLAGGRLVFAAWSVKDNELYVIEMGPEQVNIWSYVAKHSFQIARLMDYNEKERTFTLAYTPIEQGISEHSLLLQKFSLVS